MMDDSEDTEVAVIENKYENTEILNESFFDNPEFYNTVTDVILMPDENHIYTTDDFIFNNCDIAAFKKEHNGSWHLEQGEALTITVAIDTSFAACEPQGEYIEFAYIINGKFTSFHVQKIADSPTQIAFVAPETGDYYFAIVNATISYVKVTELKIG